MKTLFVIALILIGNISLAQNDTTYWDNGKIKSKTQCISDSCATINYYETGNLKSLNISINGAYWIWSEEYCENGQIKKKFNPNSEKPELIIEYLCDGTLSMEYYRCRKGYRGMFKVYHKNGQVAEQGNYEKTNSPIGDQRAGLWESFTPEGKKFYEAFYENGQIVREQKF